MPILPSRFSAPDDIPNLRSADDWFFDEVDDDSANQQRVLRMNLRPEQKAVRQRINEKREKIAALRAFEQGNHRPSAEVLDREIAAFRKTLDIAQVLVDPSAKKTLDPLSANALLDLTRKHAAGLGADMEAAAFGANPPTTPAPEESTWTDWIPHTSGPCPIPEIEAKGYQIRWKTSVGREVLDEWTDRMDAAELSGWESGSVTAFRVRKGTTICRTAKGVVPEIPIWASEARVIFRGHPASGPEPSQFYCKVSPERSVPKFIGYAWGLKNIASDIIAVEFRA